MRRDLCIIVKGPSAIQVEIEHQILEASVVLRCRGVYTARPLCLSLALSPSASPLSLSSSPLLPFPSLPLSSSFPPLPPPSVLLIHFFSSLSTTPSPFPTYHLSILFLSSPSSRIPSCQVSLNSLTGLLPSPSPSAPPPIRLPPSFLSIPGPRHPTWAV
ncbi:hypothetical protein BDV59DRAFT_183729 [Aspergillus ambiguus]|uniref:uncharacterized protein n=1 Tax=Aspergillus ambiguus TaxID=176160 RepID=UPI003CCCDCE5